jgi:hypothetical protein
MTNHRNTLGWYFLQAIFLLGMMGVAMIPLRAQTDPAAPKPEPDVLIFMNGEKLIGQLVRSDAKTVTFKSEMAGQVTVGWAKVKEVHSAKTFAVVKKDVKVDRQDAGKVPQGAITVVDQKLEVRAAAAPETMPVTDAAHVVDKAAFEKAIHHARLIENWKGGITLGGSLVEATQNSESVTGALTLVRVSPAVDWLSPRNRTSLNFTTAYGILTQPNTPTVKTSIYHGDAERDEYFSQRVFGFGRASFDHNFSQGLDLQQNYGGGIGVTVFKSDKAELDLKGSANYIRQEFHDETLNQNLIGSTFSEGYMRKMKHGILLVQNLAITPSWNNTSAYSALGNINLTIPAYKRLNFTIGVIDSFLNDPPPLFKKNSFQAVMGLTYVLP